MTTIELIKAALRRLNVVAANEEPSAQDVQVSLSALNVLIDSLSASLLNIFTITPERFLLTAGQQEYTLGPEFVDGVATNADWVIDRPMRIEHATLMAYPTINGESIEATSGTLFFPLQLLNFSQFSSLTIRKLQSTWPTTVYDNGAYPLRTLTFWPVPQATVAAELWLWQPLANLETLAEPLNLPPGYERYLILKLAMELAPEFGKQVSEALKATLIEAESAIKTLNQQVTYGEPSGAFRSAARSQQQNTTQPRNLPRTW